MFGRPLERLRRAGEAPGGAAGGTWMGVNRRSMPFTASKTAVCTMAATRVAPIPVVADGTVTSVASRE